jgi:predicted lipoprotein with Yx(FWY)xxD motif
MTIKILTLALAATITLGAGAALAGQHGNKLVHSREYQGQVYVMYQNHMSLYTYDNDTVGVSNCIGACADTWIPAKLKKNAKLGESYSSIERADGTMQAAFRGMPLYLYAGDKKVGDIKGDGVGGVWKLAKP